MADSSYADRFNAATPDWIEQSGYYTKLQTTRGESQLQAVTNSIPDAIYTHWNRTAVIIVGLLVGVWTLLLTAAALYGLSELTHTAVTYDYTKLLALEYPRPQPDPPSLSELYHSLKTHAIALTILYIFYVALFAILLPGIILHEFGHYLACIKNGHDVEGYGIILLGPVPMGAFVNPADNYIDAVTWRKIASGGIMNNCLYGGLLTTVAAAWLFQSPIQIEWFTVFGESLPSGYTPSGVDVAALGVFFVGVTDLLLGVSNALPLWKLDGWHYVQAVLREWWGFEEALGQ